MSNKHQVQELRLEMPWGHIAAKAWGSPSDKHVLLVHGILDNAGSFDRLIPHLPTGFYYLCIDLPGHGLSSHFPPGVNLDFFAYVLAIRRILEKLKWKKCIYIGHSLGGQIGIAFSALYPEKIEKFISLESVGPTPIQNDELTKRIRLVHDNAIAFEDPKAPSRLYTYEEVIYGLTSLRMSTLTVEAAEALFTRSVTKVGELYKYNRDPRFKTSLRPLINLDQILTFIKELKVPIFFVLATATLGNINIQQVSEIFETFRAEGRNSFVMVEGNHDVHNNFPERVAPHVCKYLSSLKSSL